MGLSTPFFIYPFVCPSISFIECLYHVANLAWALYLYHSSSHHTCEVFIIITLAYQWVNWICPQVHVNWVA